MMRIRLGVLIALLLGTLGCATGGKHVGNGEHTLRATVTLAGIGGISPVSGKIVFGDPNTVSINGSSFPGIRPGDAVETGLAVHIHVRQPSPDPAETYDYHVVLGAGSAPGGGEVEIQGGAPKLIVEEGWVSMWGQNAVATFDWIDGGTVGATDALVIMRPLSANEVQIFSPDENTSVGRVYYECGGVKTTISLSDRYTQINRACGVTGGGEISSLPNGHDAKVFELKAKNAAREAGWR